MTVLESLHCVIDGADLTCEDMQAVVGAIMDGQCNDAVIAAFLTALRMKGETVEEIAGAARSMRERATPIPATTNGLLDTCGTGGDGLQTFNISTATAIAAAAAGVRVAKHGNRSVSSKSGSADVLEALGVRIDLSPERVADCIETVGIGFCFAPLVHGAMKHAAGVRRALGIRSIFNFLGPLTNPASAEYQLLGANSVATAEKLAGALRQLGTQQSLVVAGGNGLDECSLWGETTVFRVSSDRVTREVWTAETFGLSVADVAPLRVASADESAAMIRGVFDNQPGPARDIVIMNTAAALLACGQCEEPGRAAQTARDVIESGQARQTLEQLADYCS